MQVEYVNGIVVCPNTLGKLVGAIPRDIKHIFLDTRSIVTRQHLQDTC